MKKKQRFKFKIMTGKQTPKVDKYNEGLAYIEEDYDLFIAFYKFVRDQYKCAGLAANQCAVNDKDNRLMKNFFAIKIGTFWDIVINPEIVEYYGEPKIEEEGCLTWPGNVKILAERYPYIKVSYFNLKGESISKHVHGEEAQIWQHEVNHLLGIKEKFK